jgi:uncharacterized protein YndB with AHSA1/START domain
MPTTAASDRTAAHDTFVIERALAAPVARVFAAWSDVALKRQWNACHDDWRTQAHELDFRVGGAEHSRVVEPGGTVHTMNARFLDMVSGRRIVYLYEMLLDDVRISVSLVTVMFQEVRRGGRATTNMTFTEQVTFLDGHGDAGARREGTEVGLGRLARMLTDS